MEGSNKLIDIDAEGQEQEIAAQEAAAKAKKAKLKQGVQQGRARADYWQWLKPVIVKHKSKPLQCMLECTRGGEGVCGKHLSSQNPAKTAKDHFTYQACKGLHIEQGQAHLMGQEQQALGNIFSKTRNRLEQAHKIAFVRSNSSSTAGGADEELQLSVADLE